ncbi:MAG: hypothetical protein H6594_05955 [Flavobacteriales bacterium]|nr:hypothetical protein [Flavobacteriales bacterium]
MRTPKRWPIATWGLVLLPVLVHAQEEALLVSDEFHIDQEQLEDPSAAISAYDAFNTRLGGDSVRLCDGLPCIGWVEDHYASGQLKHRGYYDDGRLVLYKNYHPDGTLERDFRSSDEIRSVLRTYHSNGELWSESRLVRDLLAKYEEYYRNGQLRYVQEKDKNGDYYTRMDLYDPAGLPISTLELVDRRHVILEQREFHPNGQKRLEGRAAFDPSLHDIRRVGTWTIYDADGNAVREDHYVDGKVHETVDLH